MSRSNSFNYSLNRNELIQHAYIESGLKSEGESLTASEINRGSSILNWMFKAWSADNVQLWKRKQATLFTIKNQSSYQLGTTGTHCTNLYSSTTISSNESIGQTAISITSNSGMSNGDFIGIELDDGSRFWTTIVSSTSNTVIINNALTVAASQGNTVVNYTSKIYRPLRIIRATKFDLNNNTENKLLPISHNNYFDLPLKSTAGDPNNYYYDKQLDLGILYVYPTPSNVDNIIKFSYHELLMDMDSSSDDFDFPSEWYWPIILNLAVELARSKGNSDKVQALEPMASMVLEKLKCFDADMEPLRFKFKR